MIMNHADGVIADMQTQINELLTALQISATALETISLSAGRDPFLDDFEKVRAYAYLKSVMANKSLAEGGAA